MKINLKFLTVCLCFYVNLLHGTYGALTAYFMEDLCFSKREATLDIVNVNSGILFMYMPRNYTTNSFNCHLTLQTYKEGSIVLSIHGYNVHPDDTLTIKDSDGFTFGLHGHALFKDEKKSIISDRILVINYTRNSPYPKRIKRSTFQFTFTKVDEYPSGKCFDNEFQCKNNKCILKSLTCDGHNHCGDNSDQINCNPRHFKINKKYANPIKDSHYVIIIVLAMISSFLLLVVIIIFITIMIRGRRIRFKSAEQSQAISDISLQSVPATASSNISQPQTSPNAIQRSKAGARRENIYDRMSHYFRRPKEVNAEDISKPHETFQVPSMYPSLEQVPTAPHLAGEENPNFKAEK